MPAMGEFKLWLIANRDWLEPLAALVTILVVLFPAALFRKPLMAFAAWLWQHRPRISFGEPRVPRTELRIVTMPRSGHWSIGTWDNKPTMQGICAWYVTNVSAVSLRLLDCQPYRPRLTERWHASLSTFADDTPVVADDVTLTTSGSPSTRVYRVAWMMSPPPKHVEGHPLWVRMLLVDKFGHRHKTPWTELRPPSAPRPAT